MNVPKIMVFRPTMEEFSNFSRYIQYMESQGAHHAGVAKVIPPKEWSPCQSYDNIDNFVIPAPIEQVVTGQKGLYTQYNIQKKPMTVKEFRHLTNTPRYEPPFHESFEEIERSYWKNMTFNSAIYGADISGSLYDKEVAIWNVAKLNTLLDVIENDSGVKIEGVNTAYLYFGMWKTTFAWHTEDMDLYSINYLHFGAPKSWYAIPPDHGKRLERLASGFYPNAKSNCSSFLRHKMTLISPTILKEYGIPVNKITQEAGEFMITFPYGYHAGFNHGFNCAESTNFASERWIDYGKAAEKCTCRNDTVTIDMDIFVQLFQPKQYEKWKMQKQETKLCHNDWPSQPDMTAHFPTWQEKVEEYRKLCDISALLTKLRKPRKEKPSSKLKLQASRSPTKSSSKQKKKRETSSKPSTLSKKLELPQLTAHSSTNDKLASAISPPLDGISPGISGLTVFDRIKSGSRRKSSAKPVASAADIEQAIGPAVPQLSLFAEPPQLTPRPDLPSINENPSCSVKCEPLSSLPYKVISENPLVVKVVDDVEPKTSGVKRPRRRPANKKSSKKTCSSVLVKCEHSNKNDTSEEAAFTSSEITRVQSDKQADFKEEMEYNQLIAKLPPYCAICSLFKPHFKTPISDVTTHRGLPSCLPNPPPGNPKHVAGDRTAPLIPEVSFASNLTSPSPLAECQLLDKNGKSLLLQCFICRVQVHASCYGVVDPFQDFSLPWTCKRCVLSDWEASCRLCCLRGGALKQITGGNDWAHIVCAITIPEVYFENTVQREDINISKIPAKRLKMKCIYGGKAAGRPGACLQCCSSRCSTAFHATCAHAAGILVEPGNWPFPVYAHCHKHTLLRTKVKEDSRPVEVDSYVIAKHKNGKYYHARVAKMKKETFFKANFKDNSWSENLYAQDIVSHDWSSGELPVVGSSVEILWTDGKVYDAEYRGHSVEESIQVEFDDGLLIDYERHEIFMVGDPMPAKLRRKLRTQHATPLIPVGSE